MTLSQVATLSWRTGAYFRRIKWRDKLVNCPRGKKVPMCCCVRLPRIYISGQMKEWTPTFWDIVANDYEVEEAKEKLQ